MVKRLIEYRWSSYPVYAYGKRSPEWLKTDVILSCFGGRGGHKGYREKVQDYAGEEMRLWEDFRHGVIWEVRNSWRTFGCREGVLQLTKKSRNRRR